MGNSSSRATLTAKLIYHDGGLKDCPKTHDYHTVLVLAKKGSQATTYVYYRSPDYLSHVCFDELGKNTVDGKVVASAEFDKVRRIRLVDKVLAEASETECCQSWCERAFEQLEGRWVFSGGRNAWKGKWKGMKEVWKRHENTHSEHGGSADCADTL